MQRVLAIVNPQAGSGEPDLRALGRELANLGFALESRTLDPTLPIADPLQDVRLFRAVVAVGGDGTSSSILYALRDTGIPVALFPAGTANLAVRNLSLPRDPRAIAATIARGLVRRYDLGELYLASPTGFFVMAGAGFDAAIMERAQTLKATLGELAYLAAALQEPSPPTSTFILALDDRTVVTEGIAVVIINLARIQFDLAVTHASDPADGRFDVACLTPRSVPGLAPALLAALLDRIVEHADRPGLLTYTASRVEIRSEPPLPVQYDGEAPGNTTPLRARVLPGAATILVPELEP